MHIKKPLVANEGGNVKNENSTEGKMELVVNVFSFCNK
jgi:hypothetical protein